MCVCVCVCVCVYHVRIVWGRPVRKSLKYITWDITKNILYFY